VFINTTTAAAATFCCWI